MIKPCDKCQGTRIIGKKVQAFRYKETEYEYEVCDKCKGKGFIKEDENE